MADITIDGTSIGANRFLILDSTGKIPAVDGSLVTAIAAGNIATGTIPMARIDTGSTANKIVILDGSGRLPAVSGALLTSVSSSTKSASNPTISTNPSGGVGTEWQNTTSGEVYICTDATAGENVWTNVGAGSGNIQPHAFQGSNYGFTYGGYIHPTAARTNNVDRTSFTSDGNATDVGDMTVGRGTWSGHSSATYGYACGGYSPSHHDTIDRVSFSAMGTMTDVGNLTQVKQNMGGVSSETYGYCCGSSQQTNEIERFQMVASANAVDVGDLVTALSQICGHSDIENSYGYCSAGSPHSNVIQRFAMASSGNSADVGDLTVAWGERAGNSSVTHGYTTGKAETSTSSNAIDKFAFAATSNSTDIGDLPFQLHESCGCSSTTNGYTMGGGRQAAPTSSERQGSDYIFKFSFSADGNGTDIGNLSISLGYLGSNGSQH